MPKLRQTLIFETTFGTYRADEIIGEGGAGRVFAGTAPEGTPIAIKLLTSASTDKRQRFKNEINFHLHSKHQNIVNVLDHGLAKEGPFYVMQRYNGNLRDRIKNGINPARALTLFSQILNGVEAAHLLGVVHRDLKPENILWHEPTQTLAVADFGIAHFNEALLATAVQTRDDQRLANFQYAAPEQRTTGQPVGIPADVYALGLILNELYTGTVPHGTGYQTIASKSQEHAFLDEIVQTMLSQAPTSRPNSVDDIKARIQRYQTEAIARQRLSTFEQTVIPAEQVDEPLAHIPPQLTGVDWQRGTLILTLDRPVSPQWLRAFTEMTISGYVSGKPPGAFQFNGAQVTVNAGTHEAQLVVNHFKTWLPAATRHLKSQLEADARKREAQRREQLRREREAEEQRLNIIRKLTI